MIVFNGRQIKPHWTKNWGDNIAFELFNALSGKTIEKIHSKKLEKGNIFGLLEPSQQQGRKNGKLVSIGSVMNYTMPKDFVWGTGCIKQGSIGRKPRKITAVRGPLTRHECESQGWTCPRLYGDPALLMPLVYDLKSAAKYKFGIIPHYIEFETEFGIKTLENLERLGFKILDICSGTINFLEELSECENIFSSSLHGLIIADAYGVPNARVNISNQLVGSHFKFIDYCMSVDRQVDWGYQLTPDTTLSQLMAIKLNDKISFDSQSLFDAAPWFLPEFKDVLSIES